ncbi:MAG: restriction endonuclease subunit S [Bacteroidales bacterium]|nr:restriction endonuclease subunit S [Bacteroidales bacterium]
MKRLDEVFDILLGKSLELINCEEINNGILFISRTSSNNGVATRIKKLENLDPMPQHAITVALGGSVLSSFYQSEPFYTAFHIACLYPKKNLSEVEMLYYCYIIEQNKYRYNYGRQANRTVKGILVPSYDEIPDYINRINTISFFNKNPLSTIKLSLSIEMWKWFEVGNLFECFTTNHTIQQETENGDIPFVTRSGVNNGISGFINGEGLLKYNGNCITIGAEGIIAFYQPNIFVTGVKVYTIRHEKMNAYNAMFLITLLNLENYRYNYGNARILNKIKRERIKLPVTTEGNPDWEFMESYIKSLSYSANL